MVLKFFCPRWGSEHIEWDDFLKKVKTAGYDGVEYGIANEVPEDELESIWEKVAAFGLEIIPQHYSTTTADFGKHYETYSGWLQKILRFKSSKINSQTGRDIFSFEQNLALINLAEDFSSSSGVAICHETHRGKFSFAAHHTMEYLKRIKDLRLTLDVSHWVNVAESYLDDQLEAIDLAISRTDHIHARVGYPEGPQVPDPQAPEWKDALEIHFGWWNKVLARKINREEVSLTITCEFGPHPYLVHLPFNGGPIANQWQINLFMMNLLRQRFASRASFCE